MEIRKRMGYLGNLQKSKVRVWQSEKEMRIMLVKGKCFQKSPIQEYGKRATFASFVL